MKVVMAITITHMIIWQYYSSYKQDRHTATLLNNYDLIESEYNCSPMVSSNKCV